MNAYGCPYCGVNEGELHKTMCPALGRILPQGPAMNYRATKRWVGDFDTQDPLNDKALAATMREQPVVEPLLPTDSEARKQTPIYSGVVRYFPRALAEIARLSYAANEQHNPGEPMYWNRAKSTDHLDCLMRHLLEDGTRDSDGQLHAAKIAWRALAHLQTVLEKMEGGE